MYSLHKTLMGWRASRFKFQISTGNFNQRWTEHHRSNILKSVYLVYKIVKQLACWEEKYHYHFPSTLPTVARAIGSFPDLGVISFVTSIHCIYSRLRIGLSSSNVTWSVFFRCPSSRIQATYRPSDSDTMQLCANARGRVLLELGFYKICS